MRVALLFLSLTGSLLASGSSYAQERSPATAHPSDWHCVMDHFGEALALNEERKPLYSMLSNGASDAVSNALMAFERQLTASVKPTLPIARLYWKAGVPILCKEFVPIANTPAFADTFATPLPEGKVKFANPYTLGASLQAAYLLGGHEKLAKAGRQAIRNLDKADHYQCLVKHFLESMVFAAEVSDEVNEIAKDRGMPSTTWIYRTSIQSQIVSLITASKIDRMAEVVHRQGIPILCNDVPVILNDLN